MHASTLTTKGQVTIPLDYRKQFGLKAGDRVMFLQTPYGIIIKQATKDIRAAFGLIKAKHTVTLADMEKAIRENALKCLRKD